eukprot:10049269-Alexandrium_andersonii.AAC.1
MCIRDRVKVLITLSSRQRRPDMKATQLDNPEAPAGSNIAVGPAASPSSKWCKVTQMLLASMRVPLARGTAAVRALLGRAFTTLKHVRWLVFCCGAVQSRSKTAAAGAIDARALLLSKRPVSCASDVHSIAESSEATE